MSSGIQGNVRMDIIVACQCGQEFVAQPHLAGQLVMCPACEGWIDVPAPVVLQPLGRTEPAAAAALPQPAAAALKPTPRRSNKLWLLVSVAAFLIVVLLIGTAATAVMIGFQLARGITTRRAPTVTAGPPQAVLDPTATYPPEETDSYGSSSSASSGASSASPPANSGAPSSPTPAAPPRAEENRPAIPVEPPARPVAPEAVKEPEKPKLPEGWRTYTSDVARFSVGFPGIRVDQPPGTVASSRLLENFVSASENGSIAMVLVHDMSSARVAGFQSRVASDMLDEMLKPAGARDVERKEITVFGHAGLSARFVGNIAGQEAVFQVQVFAVHGWVYQVVWASPVGKGKESDSEPFFASFQLTGRRSP